MAYDFSHFKTGASAAEAWLKKEYAGVNTGRATPALLDSVHFEAYGAPTPVAHVASILSEDPRTLRVTPWDKNQIKDIEKAIVASNLGFSVSADDAGLRVGIPLLTTENRVALIKALKGKLEEAKVKVRGEREKAWSDIQAEERDGKLSEDEKFRGKDELQKLVLDVNKKLEQIFEKKEKEVLG